MSLDCVTLLLGKRVREKGTELFRAQVFHVYQLELCAQSLPAMCVCIDETAVRFLSPELFCAIMAVDRLRRDAVVFVSTSQ